MFRLRELYLLSAAVLLGGGAAWGQAVQLPTFRFSTVNTTVSVPDRGSVHLGGVTRSSAGRVERGVPILGKVPGLGRAFNNTGIGRRASTGNMSVTAQIIDLNELDEMILGRAAAMRGARGGQVTAIERRAAFLSKNVARDMPGRVLAEAPKRPMPSVEEIRRQNLAAAEQRAREAEYYFARGNNAEAAGKKGAAKVYYRMAARRADGDLKTKALARLNYLTAATAAAKLAATKR